MSALQRKVAEDQERLRAANAVSVAVAAPEAPPAPLKIVPPSAPAQNDAEGPPSDADINATQNATAEAKKAEIAVRTEAAISTLKLFVDQHGASRLMIVRNNGRLDVPLADSTEATDHIRSVLESASGKRAPRELIESITSRLRATARESGAVRTTFQRVGKHLDSVLLDMARPDGAVIAIDATSYQVQPQGETVFIRGSGTGELPEPEQVTLSEAANTLTEYFGYLGIGVADHDALLVLLANWLFPDTPNPMLEIVGPAGTGKTSAAVGLAHITDPTKSGGLPSMRLTEEDVMASVQNRYALHVDNASRLSADQQDLLCRASTGGDLMHRKLYEQGMVAAVTLLNPVIVTGITPVITRSDARSRTLSITLKPRPAGIESAIDVRSKFAALHPRLLGSVCALLSAALQGLAAVKNQRKYEHRLADFEQLGEAIHQARGWPPGDFGQIMAERRRSDATRAAEEDGLLAAILRIIDKHVSTATVRAAPPPATTWAKTPGATAWFDGKGLVFVAFSMRQLLQDARQGTSFGDSEKALVNEKALRHAITHRQPTLIALGWTVTMRDINDRSGIVFGRTSA
jgi:hypothetical protein